MQPGQESARQPMQGDADPRHHAQKIKQRLQETSDHLREDVDKVTEPQARALFETSAEVIDGLIRAFDHYENKSESAWKS